MTVDAPERTALTMLSCPDFLGGTQPVRGDVGDILGASWRGHNPYGWSSWLAPYGQSSTVVDAWGNEPAAYGSSRQWIGMTVRTSSAGFRTISALKS
ncbi:hypothetical protein N7499_012269 [Penicillium canescens]|uniref:Uncharacterized protein n=1 Tax=Penicillium canescens TaxID=5083 RepID=A0AAD6I346_PENCN|nr:uncharacterized protein N7446_001084 [Penicillium canescens]KAJ6013124.1 hypothetical protein N7522_003479 [Penicillium canescens]KAJ6029854.1 hypothetical protein N7460_010120 [Penicillium canescens]KAJ6060235.1 hypothetical protein N7444_002089 [Penicillium canescens]KAJ6063589.1 hypothetical protein N7499_012269 [Penicillium canescens]KAJ6078148.1 hypothetical protein N7446_001084 [Penicillium canescens]